MIRTARKLRRKIAAGSLIVLVVLIPVVMYIYSHARSADAAWFNDNWAYRKEIPISAHTGAETNVYINPGATGSNGGPVKIDDAGDPGTLFGVARNLVRTTTNGGTLYTVINDGGSCEIWSSANGSSWTEQDSSDNPACSGPSVEVALAIDSTNTLHMAYFDSVDATLVKYITFDTSTNQFGSIETVLDGTGSSGNFVAIAIDLNNKPHIATCVSGPSNCANYYSNRVTDAWSSAVSLNTSFSSGVDIAINEDNIPEIVLDDNEGPQVDLYAFVGNANNSTSFTTQNIDSSSSAGNNIIGSIAIDPSGNTWVSYIDGNNFVSLRKHNDADAWSTWQAAVTNSNPGNNPTMAINGSDIYLVYQDTADNDIKYDRYNGSTWLGETLLQTGTFQGVHTKWSMYFNNSGNSLIDYMYSDGTDVYWASINFSRVLDTSDTTKFQGDCGDIRFTDASGNLLPYYIAAGCGTAQTIIHVFMKSFPAGAQNIYMYYGNPSAPNGFSASDFATAATGVTFGSLGAEEYAPAPISYWKFDEGYGESTADSSSNKVTANFSGTPSWQTEDQCISIKCIYFPGGSTPSRVDLNRSFVQTSGKVLADNVDSTTAILPSAPTAGNLIVVYVACWKSGGCTLTGSNITDGVNTYHEAVQASDNNALSGIFYAYNVSGSSTNIVIDPSSTGNYITATVVEYAGAITTDPLDRTASSTSSSVVATANSGTTAATTQATELVVASMQGTIGPSMTIGTPTGFNSVLNEGDNTIHQAAAGAYKIVESTGTQNATWSMSPDSRYAAVIATFKLSSQAFKSIPNVKSVSFWVRPASSSAALVDLSTTDASIIASSGTISAPNFTSPTYYINGQQTSSPTLVANKWNFVTVTTGTGITANAIKIGNVKGDYLMGTMDEVKLYDFVISADQVKANYDSRGANSAGAVLGASDNDPGALSSGLVGYWKMDEASGNAIDSSGNGLTGTDTSTTVTTGKYANGRSFNGTTSNFSMGDNLDFERTDPFTLTAWVKRASAATVDFIIAKEDNDNVGEGYSMALLGNGTVYFDLQNNQTTNSISVQGSVNVRDNAWHQIVVTYDGSSKASGVKIYTDGTLNTNTVNRDTLTATTVTAEPFLLGCRTGCTLQEYAGTMDEVRVYNRALTGADVANLYNWAPGPSTYWKFEEGTGTDVADSSGYGNNGTFGGDTYPKWIAGKVGKAIAFDRDGTNKNVYAGNIAPTRDFTYSFWTQLQSTSNQRTLFTQNGALTGADQEIMVAATPNGFRTLSVTLNGSVVVESAALDLNKWYYVTITRSGSNVSIYLNGVVSDTGTDGTELTFDSSCIFWIGVQQWNNGCASGTITHEWAGYLDDFKIYNYARTPGQITQDMNSGHPAPGSPIGSPFISYKFDEGYGTVAGNSGNLGIINNGTINGALWRQNSKIKAGLDFDSNNNRVYTTVALPTTDFTYSTWFRSRGLPGAGVAQYILNGESAATGDNDELIMGVDENGIIFACTNSATGCAESSSGIQTNTWYHAVFTRIGSTLQLYINGKPQVSGTDGTALTFDANCNLYIGTDPTNGCDESGNTFAAGWGWNGTLDEFKAYNYGLTQAQVLVDYNQGKNLVLGALSDTSQLTGGSVASNSASAEYCVPGASDTCSSPVGRWSMEQGTGTSAVDTSTYGNNGTLTGPTWTQGKIGKGLSFDGTADLVSIPNSTNYDSAIGTWSGWFKTTSSARTTIMSRNNNGLFGLMVNHDSFSNRGLSVEGTSGVGAVLGLYSNRMVNDGKWHHFTVVYNQGNGTTSYLYLDGVLAASGTSSTAWTWGAWATRLGDNQDSFWADFTGQIDEVRMYNYARTPAQVAWDYNQGGPVGYWKLDECQGSSIYNSMIPGNVGTWEDTGGTYTSPGTCTVSSASSAWYNGRIGKFNASLAFDGVDDLVQIPNNTAYNFTTDFGISLWFKRATTDLDIIFSKSDVGGSSYWELVLCGEALCAGSAANDNHLTFIVTGGTQAGISTRTITDTNWHHLAATRTGSSLSYYIDGKLDSTHTFSNALDTNTNDLWIGNEPYYAPGYSEGQIDDVRLYNYGLTSAQMKMIYNQGSAVRFGPLTGSP